MSGRKRTKKRLSYLDYVIILSILFFVVGLFARYSASERHSESSHAVSADIVFELRGVSLEGAYALLSDPVLYTSEGIELGEVMADTVSVRPSDVRVVAPDGTVKSVKSRTLYDVEAVAISHGARTQGGFFLSGVSYIAPNMTMTVKSSCQSFEIYVTNIEIF